MSKDVSMYAYPGNGYYYVICDVCGKKTRFKDTVLIRDKYNYQNGLLVCKKDADKTNPQSYLRAKKERPNPKSTRGEGPDVFISTPNTLGGSNMAFLTTDQLALDSGSSLIGHVASGIGAVGGTVRDKLRQFVHLWDFLSQAKRNSIDAGTQTDVTIELQAAIDSFANTSTTGTVWIQGNLKITSTIYLRASGTEIRGYGFYNTQVEYVNASGGTAFAGHSGGLGNVIYYCGLRDFLITGNTASTAPDKCLDISTMSYSTFHIGAYTKRANGICIYARGNSPSAPYYNTISGFLGGNISDRTQIGIKFDEGTVLGSGPNSNYIGPFPRCETLGIVVDLVAGNGNKFYGIMGESIGTTYFRLNNRSADLTGTSSGSNTVSTLIDSSKTMTTNYYTNSAIQITGGTGSGQVRMIANNNSTTFTLKNPWAVIPDNTSTYSVYLGICYNNSFYGCRAEGNSSSNPDFIKALPGAFGNEFFSSTVTSIGSGLIVRDTSGDVTNKFHNGTKSLITYTFAAPNASANVNAFPRAAGGEGGLMIPIYTVEWMSVVIDEATHTGTATVTLDVGGTSVGGGTVSLQTVSPANRSAALVIPTSTKKISKDGYNNRLFLNCTTDGSFSATANVMVTICVITDTY